MVLAKYGARWMGRLSWPCHPPVMQKMLKKPLRAGSPGCKGFLIGDVKR